ncbi:unnamed protein product [Colias eurytheme]|nr:unnamed protein product [Colias eurytheme]
MNKALMHQVYNILQYNPQNEASIASGLRAPAGRAAASPGHDPAPRDPAPRTSAPVNTSDGLLATNVYITSLVRSVAEVRRATIATRERLAGRRGDAGLGVWIRDIPVEPSRQRLMIQTRQVSSV